MSRTNIEDAVITGANIRGAIRYGVTRLSDAAQALRYGHGSDHLDDAFASRTLTLPAVDASMRGLTLYFVNAAAFTLLINNSTAGLVATIPATVGATGMVTCLGDTTLGVGGWTGGL